MILILSIFATKKYRFFIILFFIIGAFQNWHINHSYNILSNKLKVHENNKISIEGTFIKINNQTKNSIFKIHLTEMYIKIKHKNKLSVNNEILKITGKFISPIKNRNPGGFNQKKYFQNKKIIGTIELQEILKVEKSTNLNIFKSIAKSIKKRIINIHQQSLSYPYSDLFIGLIFGKDGTQLPIKLNNLYQKCGLIHLLVVSGAQTTLITQTVIQCLKWFKISNFLQFLVVTIIQIIFYFITGGGETILRAILMNEMALGVSLLYRQISPMHTLSTTALILGVINPLAYKNIGFQLSFLATASLIYVTPIGEKLLPKNWPSKIKKWISVSITPSIITMPIIAYYFNVLNLLSLLSNLLIVIWIEVLVIYGFFTTLIGLVFPKVLIITNKIPLLIMMLLNKLVNFLAKIPYSNLSTGKISLVIILLIYLAIIITITRHLYPELNSNYLKKLNINKKKITILILLIFLYHYPKSNKNLKLLFLDVDQGDCTLIITENNKTILIDGGNANQFKDQGISSILPALRYYKINQIDYVILTHADSDHYMGLISVINGMETKKFLYNGNLIPEPLTKELENKKVKIEVFPKKGIKVDTITIKNLNQYPEYFKEKNNKSLVLKISHKNNNFLLPGDIEEETENYLKNSNELNNIQVLKIPHHGSKTSSTWPFLLKINPKFAIISSGVKNNFNHPHPLVLKRIKKLSVKLLRTDKNGAIKIESNGILLNISTML